jgi:cell division protein FtsL
MDAQKGLTIIKDILLAVVIAILLCALVVMAVHDISKAIEHDRQAWAEYFKELRR